MSRKILILSRLWLAKPMRLRGNLINNMDQDIDLAKLLVGKLDGKERQVSRFFALKKMVSIRHARYGTFQMAEVLVSRSLFYEILERIKRLKPVPNWI